MMNDYDFDEEAEIWGDDLAEEDEALDEVIRAKWCMDGADSLLEAADKLRAYAGYLEDLADEGWVLRDVIEDDYGVVYQSNPSGPKSLTEPDI